MPKRMTWEVEPRSDGRWAVQRTGTQRADSLHEKKIAAIARVRELGAGAAPHGQVRVKGRNGRIQQEWTFGNDPKRTRG